MFKLFQKSASKVPVKLHNQVTTNSGGVY